MRRLFHTMTQTCKGINVTDVVITLVGASIPFVVYGCTGDVSGWVMLLGILVILAGAVFQWRCWRCPHCGSWLGHSRYFLEYWSFPNFCPNCGKPITDPLTPYPDEKS